MTHATAITADPAPEATTTAPLATATVTAGVLLLALSWAEPITKDRLYAAEGDAVGLRFGPDALHLVATGSHYPAKGAELALAVDIPARVEQAAPDHTAAIPMTGLLRLLRLMSRRAELTLTLADDQLHVSAGMIAATITHLGTDEAPPVTARAPDPMTARPAVDPAALRAWLAGVAPCISTEETRFYLNGIYIEAEGKTLLATATDGHRMRRRALPRPSGVTAGRPLTNGFILPRLAWTVLSAILGRATDAAFLFQDGQAHVAATLRNGVSVHLAATGVDGQFPAYRRVVPDGDLQTFAHLDGRAAAATCRHLMAVCGGGKSGYRAVKVARDVDRDAVTLSGTSVDRDVSLEAACGTPGAWTGCGRVGLNARYLAQMLDGLGDEVTLRADATNRDHYSGEHAGPVLLTGTKSGLHDLNILMPMRL